MNKDPVLAVYVGPGAKRERMTFRVEGGLHYMRGNSAPYFSLTASGFDHGSEFGGCCHDVILKHYPKFADLAALHLSDIDGVPMHAEANGWYDLAGYFGGAGERYHVGNSKRHFPIEAPADKPWMNTEYREPTQDECLQIWAEHCRIDIDTARRAAAEIAVKWNWPDMRKAHAAFIEAQKPRWKAEADACIAKHNLVVYGDPWPQAA
jgi:hypothetical protein